MGDYLKYWMLLIPLVAGLAGALDGQSGDVSLDPGCRVLPNGRVVRLTGVCPLRTHDEIRTVSDSVHPEGVPFTSGVLSAVLGQPGFAVAGKTAAGRAVDIVLPTEEGGSNRTVARLGMTAIILVGLLAIPFAVVRRSIEPAAAPLLAIAAVSGTIVVAARHSSRSLDWILIGCLAVLPAVTAHLGLTMPRVRRSLLATTLGIWIPYVAAAILLLAATSAYSRNGAYWSQVLWIVCMLQVAALALLISTCVVAARDSTSLTERSRARLLGWGALLAPLATAAIVSPPDPSAAELALAVAMSSGVALTVPVAVAISRYNLFSLGNDLRAVVAKGLYVLATAVLIAALWEMSSWIAERTGQEGSAPWLVGIAAAGGLMLAEPWRRRTVDFLEGYIAPEAGRLAHASEVFGAKIHSLESAPRIAAKLAESAADTLQVRGACVFIRVAGRLVPHAGASGAAAFRPSALDLAEALGPMSLVSLAALERRGSGAAYDRLRQQGVSLVARIGGPHTPAGLIGLGERKSGRGYSREELRFVDRLARHAGRALYLSRATEKLLLAESAATRSTLAAGLLHDVGKQTNWMRMLAARLRQGGGAVERDLDSIVRLSNEVTGRIREFVGRSTKGGVEKTALVRVVERGIDVVSQIHEEAMIEFSMAPAARNVLVDPELTHVVANLLDNSLVVTEGSCLVFVLADVRDDVLVLSVTDDGPGLQVSPDLDPFDLGVTTRSDSGGSGTGLTYVREVVRGLGGSVELQPNHPTGVRVTIRLPLG